MAKSTKVPGVPRGFTGHILQICKGRGSQPFFIRFIARNRQVRLVSEGYPTHSHAKRAAQSLVRARSAPWVIIGE